jgi:hypothetical protein
MISLPRSSFELAPRRALFLSAHKAAVYQWKGGDLGSSFLFDANEEGRELFGRYLKESQNAPMFVLVDVFEEEFRRDTIPHVFGSDRDAIVSRKKARAFRDSQYFHYIVEGRETEGRRDDRVLMSAITNANLLRPWLKLLDEHKVPLAGVTSVPIFTKSLLKLLPEQKDNMLIVSLQSISGLRQTFVHKGELRISRLVQLPRYGTEPYGPQIREEVEKIRRYLTSLRLSSDEEAVDVYFLATGELLSELRGAYKDSGFSRYHVLDINDLMATAGSKRRLSTPFSDQLFVHQLLKQRPANAYASGSDRRYFTMRRLRYSMIAASVVFLAASIGWSGMNFMGGLALKQGSLAAQRKTQFYNARYQMARERLPQTPVEPADIQVAVELADALEQYRATPLDMMRLLSAGLQKVPQVQFDSIDWAARLNPDADIRSDVPTAAPAGVQAVPAAAQQARYRFYQIAVVDAKLVPFDGNFREAIATINNFAEILRSMDSVYDVQIQSLPLDISSSAHLQGSTAAEQRSATFSIRVVLGVGREA